MAKSFVAKNGIIGAVAIIGLAGCSSISNMIEPNKIDYKSAGKVTTASLEVPPDLTQIRRDSRFAIPDANKSSATASSYNLEKGMKQATGTTASVAPLQLKNMRIMRDGSQRWLVVGQTPEVLWPQIKDFWQELGFLINVENQEAGVMETDWAENRAKIPQDIIRSTLGKVIDSLYSTGERDKFRTRLERSANGEVEIYISHRGAQEVVTGTQKDGTIWTPRPADPGLEAEFLSRLMVRLGSDAEVAKAAVTTAAAPVKPRSQLLKSGELSYVEVDEGFERSWRRVGLALDRVGFTVEDRDRSQGLYFVRYIDQDIDARSKGASEGFFSRLFSFGSSSDAAKDAKRYRILVKNAGNGEVSHISVHNNDGKIDSSPVAEKILQLLNEQLK
ncbi:outer membrane protein assembly factor BamC [Undibacterium oligocarboniphilum]|uniref:Outer membrane protein assembly factor BamC n=1 Tax=Undibacterium oligocarboniphilum TaxID=666702 RepID=A0A850QEW9_9BURK|nr:outer membrane protein assembly factor BamC [Undibacterium oligocarboniphilum]MBC3870130.1 outer membrane protein assembly factor BamC [Undibacterium oligocarboniphilum]NVO78121.1 outer membrane protein assembly factor BamC [Undibacterium oligocarboniphilum]